MPLRTTVSLLLLAFLLLAGPVASAQEKGVLMQAQKAAKIRKERNAASAVLDGLRPGQQVKAGFPADNWLAVFPPDSPAGDESQRLGYVFAPLLTPVAEAATEAPPARDQAAPAVAKPTPTPAAEPAAPAAAKPAAPAREPGAPMQAKSVAKIRSERNTASPVLGRLDPGQRVKAGFPADNWLAVFPPDSPANDESQRLGYVFAPLLTAAIEAPPVQAAPAPAKTGPGPEAPRPQATPSAAYTVLEKQSVERPAGPWLEFKVMLKAETLPSPDDLKTLAATIRAGMAGAAPRVAVHFYLPGLDLQGLSYAIVRFDPEGLAEFWTRDTALYGTPWAKFIR